MVLWRERLVFQQYIKNIRHKYSVKLYILTEPTGIILNVNVYTGALDIIGGRGRAAKVVLHLMKDRFKSGYALYMVKIWLQNCKKGNILYQNTADIVKAKLVKGEDFVRGTTKNVFQLGNGGISGMFCTSVRNSLTI